VFKFDEVARSTRVSILFILVGFLGVVWGVGSSIASQRIVGAFLASLAFIANLVCIFRFWKRYNLFIISLLRASLAMLFAGVLWLDVFDVIKENSATHLLGVLSLASWLLIWTLPALLVSKPFEGDELERLVKDKVNELLGGP
jgi:hypothetical protein